MQNTHDGPRFPPIWTFSQIVLRLRGRCIRETETESFLINFHKIWTYFDKTANYSKGSSDFIINRCWLRACQTVHWFNLICTQCDVYCFMSDSLTSQLLSKPLLLVLLHNTVVSVNLYWIVSLQNNMCGGAVFFNLCRFLLLLFVQCSGLRRSIGWHRPRLQLSRTEYVVEDGTERVDSGCDEEHSSPRLARLLQDTFHKTANLSLKNFPMMLSAKSGHLRQTSTSTSSSQRLFVVH